MVRRHEPWRAYLGVFVILRSVVLKSPKVCPYCSSILADVLAPKAGTDKISAEFSSDGLIVVIRTP